MPVETLNCPNCGAPLRPPPFEGPWICVYCNSLIRVQVEAGAPQTSLESRLDATAMDSVKQLLLSGQRDEAIQRYQQISGVDLEQARRTIDQMGADFSIHTVFHQQLTPGGIALVIISLIVLLASLLAWALGWLNTWLALILAGLAAFELFVYGRGALTTIRYRNAPVAPATTLHFAHIGAVQRGRLRVHTFKCILEVHPKDGPPFQAEAIIPVREENVPGVRQGEVIQVKYLPGRPDSVIYHQAVE